MLQCQASSSCFFHSWRAQQRKELHVNAGSCGIKKYGLNKGHLATQSISGEIKIARG